MKATKTTMTVTIEVLSLDSIPGLLIEVANRIRSEFPKGELTATDGDNVKWDCHQAEVEF